MAHEILNPDTAREIAGTYGTPAFVYSERILLEQADRALAFPAPDGLTVRYAMKACPSKAILELFAAKGLHFDASSGYEVRRLLKAGILPEKISLSTQELPGDFAELVQAGISVNACSLNQLDRYGEAFPGREVGLRFNPGLGSGSTNRTNVGGPSSSFGIWHEKIGEAKALLDKHSLTAFRVHTHIGSGSDPEVWKRAASLSLRIAAAFPSVTHLNLGGGYKIARMEGDKGTDLEAIAPPVLRLLEDFKKENGRSLHIELEPGTLLVGNAGMVLSRIQDIVDTGADGFLFWKLDCGMTEILRPSLYGAQHPIIPLGSPAGTSPTDVIVVGHCCESGDILTPAPGDPEGLQTRDLPAASIGDLVAIGGSGAYCSAMSAKNYNSFPEAPEILVRLDGKIRLIRKRQTLEQILENEQGL